MKKFAFTLAETLITLVIIGVVAAITIPSVIAKYQERAAVSAVKKAYSTISSAFLLSVFENGTADSWERGSTNSPTDSFAENFLSHIKTSKICGRDSGLGCMESGIYTRADGQIHTADYETQMYYKTILLDGSYLFFRMSTLNGGDTPCSTNYNQGCATVFVDINGKEKPNVVGKDLFVFTAFPDKIMPRSGCPASETGHGWCAASYVLHHGDLGYLKDLSKLDEYSYEE